MRILVTGATELIGSALVRHLAASTEDDAITINALPYAGTLTVRTGRGQPRHAYANVTFFITDRSGHDLAMRRCVMDPA